MNFVVMPKGIPKNGINSGWFKTKKKISKSCEQCGRLFKVIKSREDARFCSRNCYDKYRKNNDLSNKIELTCEYCGNSYKVYPSRKDRSKYCSKECQTKGIALDELSEEHKRKIGDANKGNSRPDLSKYNKEHPMRGEENPGWKDGRTPITKRVRHSKKYKDWQKKVMIRDNYTCQDCGKHGGEMHIHHKKHFSTIWEENEIKTFCEALDCEELWNIDNGIALCPDCHYKHH